MKNKFIAILIALLSILIITGCGTQKENNITTNNDTKTDKKIAVIYFSATGNTKEVAESIKDITGGELTEIIPLKEYTSADLNYNDSNTRATKEQNNPSSRPEIKNTINVDYDVIYLGYPIWWGDVPHIILTFIDTYDLDGKTIIPFCTSGSSSIDNSLNTLKNYNININWVDGKRLTNNKKEIENWINSLNY
jgi:flavodoxin